MMKGGKLEYKNTSCSLMMYNVCTMFLSKQDRYESECENLKDTMIIIISYVFYLVKILYVCIYLYTYKPKVVQT